MAVTLKLNVDGQMDPSFTKDDYKSAILKAVEEEVGSFSGHGHGIQPDEADYGKCTFTKEIKPGPQPF